MAGGKCSGGKSTWLVLGIFLVLSLLIVGLLISMLTRNALRSESKGMRVGIKSFLNSGIVIKTNRDLDIIAYLLPEDVTFFSSLTLQTEPEENQSQSSVVSHTQPNVNSGNFGDIYYVREPTETPNNWNVWGIYLNPNIGFQLDGQTMPHVDSSTQRIVGLSITGWTSASRLNEHKITITVMNVNDTALPSVRVTGLTRDRTSGARVESAYKNEDLTDAILRSTAKISTKHLYGGDWNIPWSKLTAMCKTYGLKTSDHEQITSTGSIVSQRNIVVKGLKFTEPAKVDAVALPGNTGPVLWMHGAIVDHQLLDRSVNPQTQPQPAPASPEVGTTPGTSNQQPATSSGKAKKTVTIQETA